MRMGCLWLLSRGGCLALTHCMQFYLQPLKHSESQGEAQQLTVKGNHTKDITAMKALQALLLVDSSSGAQIHLCSS